MPVPLPPNHVQLDHVIQAGSGAPGVRISWDYEPGVSSYQIYRTSASPGSYPKQFSVSQPNPAPPATEHLRGTTPRVSYTDFGVEGDRLPPNYEAQYFVWAVNPLGSSLKRGPYLMTPTGNPPAPAPVVNPTATTTPIEAPIFADNFNQPNGPVVLGDKWIRLYSSTGNWRYNGGQLKIEVNTFRPGLVVNPARVVNVTYPTPNDRKVSMKFAIINNPLVGETAEQRLSRISSDVYARLRTFNNVRASVDFIAYGNWTTHYEPLPVPDANDAPYLESLTKTRQRIKAIFDNRGVPLATNQDAAIGEKMGLLIRVDPQTGSGLLFTPYKVYQLTNSGMTIIADSYDGGDTFEQGDMITVISQGQYHKVYKNGAEHMATIPSSLNQTLPGVTYGIYSEWAGGHFDDFFIYPAVSKASTDPGDPGERLPNDPYLYDPINPYPSDPTVDPTNVGDDNWFVDPWKGVGVRRWHFIDVWKRGKEPYSYQLEINPNEGGSPQVTKNMNIIHNAGPNRGGIIQEGASSAPVLNFSGVILSQQHLESLEYWYDKRILIELRDDLGRRFRGVFSEFSPQRVRKPYNPWYHTFSAGFTVYGYKNASGQIRFGRF